MIRFPEFWRRPGDPRARMLYPLSLLFCSLAAWRRRRQTRAATAPVVPVLVVGSVFVGGSGKTPLVIWLAREARGNGFTPGVILRGHGGQSRQWPCLVEPTTDARMVGDEAVLIARRAGVPVAAGPDRAAARDLLVELGCDLIVADDGLQHYRLRRHVEIAVLDAEVGLGNGLCLPAGPLREPASRLAEVDLVVGSGAPVPGFGEHHYRLESGALAPVTSMASAQSAPSAGTRVHGVAGIGQPERFFRTLESLGLNVERHPFPDHHRFRAGDLPARGPVVMTEKDAVKCAEFERDDLWYLPVTAAPAEPTAEALRSLLRTARDRAQESGRDARE
jgi:tetraacyldisaccharide 4'-kinase